MKIKQRTIDTLKPTAFGVIFSLIIKKSFEKTLLPKSSNIFKMLLIMASMMFAETAWGQVVNDWRTVASGTWSASGVWEKCTSISPVTWTAQASGPTTAVAGQTITISHIITVGASITIDQVVVTSTGGITITTGTVTIADGTGTDLSVNGYIKVTATALALSGTGTPTIVFNNGSTYEHNRNFTSGIPTATWNDGSTCILSGDAAPNASFQQNFYNVTINWAAGTTARALNAFVPTQVRNKFKIIATGTSGSLVVGDGSTAASLSVAKLEVSGGTLYVGTGSGAHTLTCSDSLIVSGGTMKIAYASNNAQVYTASAKDVIVSSGTLDLNGYNSSSNNSGRLFLTGNLTVSGGTLVNSPGITTGSAGVYFNGTSTQTFTHSGGTLSTASGGVGRRFYYKTSSGPTSLNETYGAISAQTTINGAEGTAASGYAAWPTTGSLINNVTINNNVGVTLSTDKTVNSVLTLTNGLFTLGSYHLTLGSSATVAGTPSASSMVVATSTGEMRKIYTANGSFIFPVGDNTSTAEYSPVTLNFTAGTYSSAYASVKLSNSKHGSNTSSIDFINRFWTVATSGISSTTCTATFTYADGDINGTESNLFGGSYYSTAWHCMDGVITGSNSFSKSITTFGEFTAGDESTMICTSCGNPTNGGTIGNAQSNCSAFDPTEITNIGLPTGHTGTLEYQWQSSTTNNSSGFSDIGSATTATYDPVNISVTTWYKRLARVSCKADWSGAISSNVIEMTVNAIPSAPTGSATQSYCAGATVANLSATGSSLKWYDAASGGSEVTSGTTLIDNTHYFASQTTNGCESTDRLDVLTTINTIPMITSTTPSNRCGTGTVDLGASASTGTINWYAASTGGASLGTGETFTTPSISTTTSYWVDATANSCTTASRTEVVASVGAGTSITAQPSGVNVCDEAGSVATFSVSATGNNLTYQWQVSTNGTDWNNITDGGVYSNPTTNTLTITSPTLSMNSYQYRCDVGGSCAPTSVNSNAVTLGVSSAYCGSSGDYRSNVTTGNWGDASSWETHNGSAWVAAGTSPTNTNGVITIRSGHNITVAAAVSVDQVVVRSGGQVTVNGAILTIADGTGDDFVVNGIMKLSSLHSVTTTGTLVINDGGIYEHARNSGSIPTATWNTGSELKITGVGTTPPTASGTYQNVTWNCSGQTEAEVFNPTINGNLTVETTGTGSIELQNITINGNFNMNGGKVRIAKTATSTSHIKGNCNILGGDFILADGGSNDYHANLTIDGDFTLDNNVSFKFCTNATVNGKAYLWLKKDLYLKNFTPGGFLIGTALRNESSGFYLIGTQSQTVYSGIAFSSNAGMREFFFYKTAGGPTALNEVYNGSVAQYTINGMGANTNPFNPLTGYSRWPVSGDMLKNVTINNSSSEGVTMTTTKTVNTKLTLTSGTINTTDSLLLTMAAGTSVDGGSNSSYVNGPLRKVGNSAFTFPVGKSGAYAPISISAPAVVTDHFTTYYVKSTPNGSYSRSSKEATLDHVSDCEYWILNRTNGSSNVNVTLSWDTRSCGVSNLTEMRVSRWDGTQWTDAGNTATTGNVSSGTVSSNTITSFSPFTLASTTPSNILPIDFLNFNIKCQPKGIDVYWQTASELNSNFIEIETSSNSIEWTKLGSIAAQGNSNTLTNYHFSADNQNLFFSYYRLKMVDYNGGVVISTIKTIDCNQNDLIGSYDIIPNPNNGVFKLTSNTSSKPILVSIYNSLGKLIYQNNQFDDGEIFVDISHLDKGLYLLKIRTNDFEVVKKVIIN